MPQTIIGFHIYWIDTKLTAEGLLYQTQTLYDTWEAALKAAEEMATARANEHCEIINKCDDMSFSDCLHYKNTTTHILVDIRNPYEKYGAVWISPVFSAYTKKEDSVEV